MGYYLNMRTLSQLKRELFKNPEVKEAKRSRAKVSKKKRNP
jgi:hypothetical protein